jgi:uncharacterized protein (DUF885 family)
VTSENLSDLAERLVGLTIRWDPLLCSAVGIREADGLVADVARSGVAGLAEDFDSVAQQLAALDPSGFTEQERYTHQMATWQARLWPQIIASRREEYTVSPYKAWSLPTAVWSVLPKLRIASEADVVALGQRTEALPEALRLTGDALETGVRRGRPPVRRLVQATLHIMDQLLAPGADAIAVLAPAFDERLGDRPRAAYARSVVNELLPALGRLRQRLEDEVLPHARPDDRPGLCWIPGGEDAYLASVAEHTTTDLDPEQLHATGLAAVDELAEEVLPHAEAEFGVRDIRSLVERLRGDSGLRYADRVAMVADAQAGLDRGLAMLDSFVGTPPRARCEMRVMPAIEARRMMQAYYRPGDHATDRPGTFWLNTDPDRAARRYGMATLTIHESVPGHHVQWSRAREVELPAYRTLIPTTAFIEGWAMYCERSGPDLGLTCGHLELVGLWSSLSWRASRLVVDTGLHARGWTRDQAVSYLVANTATSHANAEAEIDRYVGNPGQALAYYTGLLSLVRARESARQRLGSAFDLRAFHDRVLSLGSPPLPIAEAAVDDWVAMRTRTHQPHDSSSKGRHE